MKYKAQIKVLPHPEILDAQGKAAERNLPNLGIHHLQQIRIGKYIELHVDADNEQSARTLVDEACQKLLTNRNTERYEFSIEALS